MSGERSTPDDVATHYPPSDPAWTEWVIEGPGGSGKTRSALLALGGLDGDALVVAPHRDLTQVLAQDFVLLHTAIIDVWERTRSVVVMRDGRRVTFTSADNAYAGLERGRRVRNALLDNADRASLAKLREILARDCGAERFIVT
jgi:hypothetical protein